MYYFFLFADLQLTYTLQQVLAVSVEVGYTCSHYTSYHYYIHDYYIIVTVVHSITIDSL